SAKYTTRSWAVAGRLGRVVSLRVSPVAIDPPETGRSFREWAASSAGRAPRSQRGGREFEPPAVHQLLPVHRIPSSPVAATASSSLRRCVTLGGPRRGASASFGCDSYSTTVIVVVRTIGS